MKIARFHHKQESPDRARLGVVLANGMIGDLSAGYAHFLGRKGGDLQATAIADIRIPSELARLLAGGAAARAALSDAAGHLAELGGSAADARGLDDRPLFVALADCRLAPPLVPGKMIAVGRNYGAHLTEMGSKQPFRIPSAWIKATSCMTGPFDDIVRPRATEKMDYETELCLVIAERCKNVPETRAYDVVFGYVIVNDVSARDVARLERAEGNQLLNKMFDGFAPTGPWVVTRDEIRDPMALKLRTRVNGEIRQDGSTSGMVWSIPKLIAFLSQMTLEAGDVITTGTPGGVAAGRAPELPSWFLKPGDVVESEIEGIGTMRNRIVAPPADEAVSWTW